VADGPFARRVCHRRADRWSWLGKDLTPSFAVPGRSDADRDRIPG
jgi:hypothetical protein